MNNKKQKLELTWIGKDEQPRLEPRILIEDPEKSYGHTPTPLKRGIHYGMIETKKKGILNRLILKEKHKLPYSAVNMPMNSLLKMAERNGSMY